MKSDKRIGIVLARPPALTETFLVSKIKWLQKNGFTVTVYANTADNKFNLCNCRVLPGKNPAIMLTLFKIVVLNPLALIRFIRFEFQDNISLNNIVKNMYSCIHLLSDRKNETIHFGFLTMAVGRENIARAFRSRMSASIRGYDISRYPLNKPGIYIKTWPKLNRLHTISDALIQKAVRYGFDTSVTEVKKITPAINTDKFRNDTRRKTLRGTIQILTVARLFWAKGLEYTIQALSILHKKGYDFKYTIVGDGKEYERIFLAALQLGISDKVEFAGSVSHENLSEFYRKADLYIQYSIQEGFCNAVLEAQSMELPCVVSNAEGLPENILNNETGWVVEASHPELLADKIIEVIEMDQEKRSSIQNKARERVVAQFDISQQAEKFADFFS